MVLHGWARTSDTMAQELALQWLIPGRSARHCMQGAEMIQLATDPNASRLNWRPVAAEARDGSDYKRRTGHAWPFISRHSERPAPQDAKRKPTTESGS